MLELIILDLYFVALIDESVQLFCPLCRNLLHEPVQFVRTGHRFCIHCIRCISLLIQPQNVRFLPPMFCRMCVTDGIPQHSNCFRVAAGTDTRDLLNRGDIFYDRGVMREINQLRVWCLRCGRTFLYGQRSIDTGNGGWGI